MDWHDFLSPSSPDDAITDGNRIQHLRADNRIMQAIWQAIGEAEARVWMSMFTLVPDEVGRRTLQELEGAARRGCEVRLLYDGFGSLSLGDEDVAPFRRAGGRVAAFNRVWPPWKMRGRFSIRNHRKLILIDDRMGFCGGMNISEIFAGDDFGRWVFDDTMVRAEGPCVRDLMATFGRTWQETTGEGLALPPPADPYPEGLRVEVLETDPRRPETRLIEVLGGAVARAEARCQITTPYFIPAPWLRDALLQALGRGVDVRILTAGRTDVTLARLAGHHFYGELLRRGARIYEMQGRVIHTKKLTIDGAFCSVGSYNFDVWTSRHVLDASIATVDETLARSMEQEFAEALEESREITMEEWERRSMKTRAAEWMCLQLARYV